MGRKKKVQEEQIQEQPKEIKVKTPVNSVSYKGVINVSLQKGKKTYFTKTFKNKGRWPLFYFLNMCLRGDYGNAELYRPKYINVFGNADWETYPEPDFVDEESPLYHIDQYFDEPYRITAASYPYLSLPEIDKISEDVNIGSSTITYKFNIPFSQITDISHVNAFALYAKPVKTNASHTSALDDVTNPSAFFFILDEYGNVTNLLDEDDEPEGFNDDYNLYIQWTLSIWNARPQSTSVSNNSDTSTDSNESHNTTDSLDSSTSDPIDSADSADPGEIGNPEESNEPSEQEGE